MANRHSVVMQKKAIAARRMYSPAQAMAYEPCGCEHGGMPSQRTLDRIADEAFKAGWNVSRSNQCPSCGVVKCANGKCPFGCGE